MLRRLRSRTFLVLAATCASAAVFAVGGSRGTGLEGRAARWSGDATLLVLLLSWVLPLVRWLRGHADTAAGVRAMHGWVGAAFLGLLVLHGARVQSGLTAAIAVASLGVAVVGAFPPERLQAPSPAVVRAWWMAHLVLGLAVSALAAVHVYAVTAY